MAGISPGSLFHFSPLGSCLAFTTCGALADSKTPEILQPELLQEESKGPAAQGMGHELGREEKSTRTKAKHPPTPRTSEATPKRPQLPGEEFHGNLGAKRTQRHTLPPRPHHNRQVTRVHGGELVTLVHWSRWESGRRAQHWVLATRTARGSLHTAQRASKATLNSCSLLVLFFVWLGIFFFFSFK